MFLKYRDKILINLDLVSAIFFNEDENVICFLISNQVSDHGFHDDGFYNWDFETTEEFLKVKTLLEEKFINIRDIED